MNAGDRDRCDPAFPNEVWVGTTIRRVGKGTRNLANPDAPRWTWTALLSGLPEAAVQDLALFSDAGLRLLRAAIVARGVWELRLDQPEVPTLAYLRARTTTTCAIATAPRYSRGRQRDARLACQLPTCAAPLRGGR